MDYTDSIRKVAIDLAEQLATGVLDRFPGTKTATEAQLQLSIEAGDITQEEVDEIYAAHAQ